MLGGTKVTDTMNWVPSEDRFFSESTKSQLGNVALSNYSDSFFDVGVALLDFLDFRSLAGSGFHDPSEPLFETRFIDNTIVWVEYVRTIEKNGSVKRSEPITLIHFACETLNFGEWNANSFLVEV